MIYLVIFKSSQIEKFAIHKIYSQKSLRKLVPKNSTKNFLKSHPPSRSFAPVPLDPLCNLLIFSKLRA